MRNVYNALTDVVNMYTANAIDYEVVRYVAEDNLWVVKVYNKDADGSFLEIEIIDDNGIPKCCVLQKVNVGRRSMFKFMNRLVNALE